MAMGILDWLDERYVQNILQKVKNDDSIKVSGITAKAATAKGDNYSSDMHRVTVEYSRVQDASEFQEKINLIVKLAPYGDAREEVIEKAGVFKTELSVLEEILPKMNDILGKLGRTTVLGAQCFHTQYEKPAHLIVEDLAPKGFQMADRHAGLDLDHCLLAIKNLAKFHAASIALKEEDPTSVTRYYKGIFHKDMSDTMGKICKLGAKAFAEETAKWPELDPQITKKIFELSEYIFEKGCAAASYREDDFNVLNHGDCWVNNMLFRYDEHKHPTGHIFVDFQICNWGSPAIDLLYFFGTSASDDVRLHHRELLLHEYHTCLSHTMSKLQCSTEAPSFDKLQEALKHRGFLEVAASVTVLPIVVLEKEEEISFDGLLNEGEYQNPGYRGKTYRKIMTRLLPLFDSMGLLDV